MKRFEMFLPADVLAELELWRDAQEVKPSRAGAALYFLRRGLFQVAEAARKSQRLVDARRVDPEQAMKAGDEGEIERFIGEWCPATVIQIGGTHVLARNPCLDKFPQIARALMTLPSTAIYVLYEVLSPGIGLEIVAYPWYPSSFRVRETRE